MTRKRLAVARLWFEGNAFGPVPAGMAQFEQYEWQAGPEVLDTMRGTATELGAVARFADQHPDWDVVVLRCAAALPAGPIDQVVMHRYMQELRDGLQAGTQDQRWDAVYLSLHGAAIAQQSETPELDVVRMVRQLLPDTPIGASFDLHGNMPADWADVLDIASVYRTHPHIDMDDTADRVLTGLRQMVDGKLRTHRVLLNEGIILPSINMRTVPGGPMYTLEQVARDATQWPVIEVALFGGFPYADTAATGASVFVLSDASGDPSGQAAHTAAQTVMTKVRELASEFQMSLPSADSAIQQALAINRPGLIAITRSVSCGDRSETNGSYPIC
jgi:microcystin degradation protein MlrC